MPGLRGFRRGIGGPVAGKADVQNLSVNGRSRPTADSG